MKVTMSNCKICILEVENFFHTCIRCKRNKDGEHKCSLCHIDELDCNCTPIKEESLGRSNTFTTFGSGLTRASGLSGYDAIYEEKKKVVS